MIELRLKQNYNLINFYFPVSDTAEHICKIMKTLNLNFIRTKNYCKPYFPSDSYDVFLLSPVFKPRFVESLTNEGMYDTYYCQ